MNNIKNDLVEAANALKNFTENNSIQTSEFMREMTMDADKISQQKFLLENFNYCFSEYGKKLQDIANEDENVKFNGKLDSVFAILKKFVKDEIEGADFCDPEADAMRTLKRWWNENKYKFRD